MISEQAIVDKSSKLESSVEVGPFSIIGKEVEIGKNVKIQSHVVITGNTSISDNCEIYSFASIGSTPQDLKFKGEAIRSKGKVWKYKGVAYVNDKIMADSEWMATIVDRKDS